MIATGRLTTFPGSSKYQLIIDEIAPAGVGALMAMLEKRKQALAAEGLFDAARKRPLPYLPEVIGVVTSPSGAVIRDILHRLRERFPRPVLLWPVTVQGERCAPEVAAAIRGFNALAPGGPVPRPDLLIVARGGGSLEDLWGFNEEIVVRAAAESRIPLISAVGHETDTTLIDFAADRRAPTPTAAAEMAVPVRLDLIAARRRARASPAQRAGARRSRSAGQRLRDLAPRPAAAGGDASPSGRSGWTALGVRLPLALVAFTRHRISRSAAAPPAASARSCWRSASSGGASGCSRAELGLRPEAMRARHRAAARAAGGARRRGWPAPATAADPRRARPGWTRSAARWRASGRTGAGARLRHRARRRRRGADPRRRRRRAPRRSRSSSPTAGCGPRPERPARRRRRRRSRGAA